MPASLSDILAVLQNGVVAINRLRSSLTIIGSARASFSANKNGTAQTGIVVGANTQVTSSNKEWDTHNLYNASLSRWTPPSGTVYLSGAITPLLTGVAVGDTAILLFFKNGGVLKSGARTQYASTSNLISIASPVVDIANGTDFYELYVSFLGSTAAKDISGTAFTTYFQGIQLST